MSDFGLEALASRLRPGAVSVAEADRLASSTDLWPRTIIGWYLGKSPELPAAVVWPSSTSEIVTILAHAREPLTVARVAWEMGVGRRTLERHFHRALGRGVLDVIHSCRIEQIKALLSGTELPVGTVARRCGFKYPEKLMNFFRKHVGCTATQYRRRL